jgi:hypothetical protein
MLRYGRSIVDDVADRFKLSFLGVVGRRLHQRQLFLLFFAHFVSDSFLFFVVFLGVCRYSLYYIKEEKATTKCAFFIYTGKLDCRMDTIAFKKKILG